MDRGMPTEGAARPWSSAVPFVCAVLAAAAVVMHAMMNAVMNAIMNTIMNAIMNTMMPGFRAPDANTPYLR